MEAVVCVHDAWSAAHHNRRIFNMKRFALLVALAASFVLPSLAQAESVLTCEQITWRTSLAAAVGGVADSSSFKADGSSNANRDSSRWIWLGDIAPQRSQPTGLGDSTVFVRINIAPKAGSSLGVAADSLYAYLQFSAFPTLSSHVGGTNMTEILALELGTTNEFTFPITWGRRPAELGANPWMRVVVRGDLNGEYEGSICYYTETNAKAR